MAGLALGRRRDRAQLHEQAEHVGLRVALDDLAAGVTSGIDLALHLVGDDAPAVAREIEWGEARPAGSFA